MSENKKCAIKRFFSWLARPSRMALGGVLFIGIAIGIVGVVGTQETLHAVGTNEFCVSCHEMEDYIGVNYRQGVHFANESGVQATCSDCHMPNSFFPMVMRKIEASKELYGHITGVIDTPEKYLERRPHMVETEHGRMQANNFQACRTCHNFENQKSDLNVSQAHLMLIENKTACFDCHKGIGHAPMTSSSVKP